MPGRFPAVFGIGLPKSGTTTLAHMLRTIGFDHAHYDTGLIGDIANGDLSGLGAAAAAHQSFEDWPWPMVYREVFELVPGAGFILTRRRTPEIWLDSLRRHTNRNPSEKSQHLRKKFFESDDPWADEEIYLEFYKAHLSSVRAFAREHDLPLLELCWEEGDDWAKLCSFLRVEVVSGDIPHSNSALENERYDRRLRRTLKRFANTLRKAP